MAVSARQYAQSLYEAAADKSGSDLKVILKNFVRLLGRRRELGKAKDIIARFTEIWNKEKGELEAELASARELGPTAQSAVIDYLKDKTGSRTVKLTDAVQPELIGGFVLRYGDRIVDASLRSNLEALKNKISN